MDQPTPAAEFPIVSLKDGGRAILRPLTPADKPRVQEAFRRLSRESRYSRFFTPLEVLDGKLLDQLTSADGVDHVVWAAMDAERPDDPGMGAASFWRSRERPTEAEFSATVTSIRGAASARSCWPRCGCWRVASASNDSGSSPSVKTSPCCTGWKPSERRLTAMMEPPATW